MPSLILPRARARRAPVLAALAVAALGVAALALGTPSAANAAVIDGAITNVTVTPTDPHQGGQLTTNIQWQVPDGTREGDTFTLTLSDYLTDLPAGFSLDDPATGTPVADAVLSNTSPSVITFTMTAYAQTHLHTTGSAFVQSSFDASRVPSGSPTPITSTTSDGRTFTTEITPTGIVGDHTIPIKYGNFSSDEGRTDRTDFLTYRVDTPTGPSTGTTITDVVPTGQDWTFDCSTVSYVDQTLDQDNQVTLTVPVVPVAQTCDPEAGITATLPAIAASHIVELRYSVSLPVPTGTTSPAQTFLNRAVVATTAPGGAVTTDNADATNVQSVGGGSGVGGIPVAAVSIVKGDSSGHAADTDATAATLPADGSTGLVYTVTNTGTDALEGIAVTDRVVANGVVTGLSCDFSGIGGPSTGTTYAGRFAAGASFPCTATLSGVSSTGGDHHDLGTVTAIGVASGTNVTSTNAYFARVAPAAAAAADSAAPTELAFTGSNAAGPLSLAGILLALGTLLTVLNVRRRRVDGRHLAE
jgi:hypothetical protein